MARQLLLPQLPLNSHMNELQQMEVETIGLINQYSLLQKAKHDRITNAKSQINTHFENIINKLKSKQNEFLIQLDNISNDIQSEQSIFKSITSIINKQKQYISHYENKGNSYQLEINKINKINQNFNKSKQLYLSHVTSITNSISSIRHNQQILKIINTSQQYINTFQSAQSNKKAASITNHTIIEEEKDIISKKSLLNDTVYSRLQSTIKPRNNFYYQYVSEPFIPYVLSINILTEFLPNKIIKILFNYLPRLKQFNVSSYLKNGWNILNNDIKHDYPNIYIENILPIQNQPSLILTIGLPGSGKTTWAKIRNYKTLHTIIAADDYFDKFNNGIFNVGLLSKAHEWTQLNVFNALKSGYNVVVNNTNTTLSEMHTYITRVIFGKLPHKIVFTVMPETHINTLISRGIHNVPYKQCLNMLKRFNQWYKKYPPSIDAVFKAGEFKNIKFINKNKKNYCKDVLYTGVFMNKEMQDRIRKYFISISGCPLLCSITDCHLTLKFQPFYNDIDILPFGKKIKIKIIAYSMHEYVQTFLVDIMDEFGKILCSNKYPHITVSFNENFVRPNYANYLLEYGKVIPIINNFDIVNSVKYNQLYRNKKNINECNNGGLIVEGTVGAVFKGGRKNSGLKFMRPERLQRARGGFYQPEPNNSARFRR
eukprot:371786_1